ncbi:exported hypothetical protein [Paraburkholderia ribeironis]|uniref:Uncharacterized protein n=1 Tax=Paraburkholderia ribeironis TaxID=1247936 RepID=A0A1N7S687_9BURK|nr:exported hypothetical protein [Paraburkholderia ribeironis]
MFPTLAFIGAPSVAFALARVMDDQVCHPKGSQRPLSGKAMVC